MDNVIDDLTRSINTWEDQMRTNCDGYYNISLVPPIFLNFIDEVTMSINWWKDDLPNPDDDGSFLPPGLPTLFEKIEDTNRWMDNSHE